jgi:hypothetical protein
MSKFMLILYDRPSDWTNVTPEDLQRIIEEYSAWGRSLAERGKLSSSMKLKEEGGKQLLGRNGSAVVRDGPYAEATEVIGGYFAIEAANYDEAVSIARSCPHLKYSGRIEVREVDLV